jgi:zinc-ribbon domain
MRLFGRGRSNDGIEERCPHCREPVPEGAVACMMCGVDLRPLRRSGPESAGQGMTRPRRMA